MKKFISGLLLGLSLMFGITYGLDTINAESTVSQAPLEMEESEAMKLAWYEYHHETLSKALAGQCK